LTRIKEKEKGGFQKGKRGKGEEKEGPSASIRVSIDLVMSGREEKKGKGIERRDLSIPPPLHASTSPKGTQGGEKERRKKKKLSKREREKKKGNLSSMALS